MTVVTVVIVVTWVTDVNPIVYDKICEKKKIVRKEMNKLLWERKNVIFCDGFKKIVFGRKYYDLKKSVMENKLVMKNFCDENICVIKTKSMMKLNCAKMCFF